jgi:hypothetical protein
MRGVGASYIALSEGQDQTYLTVEKSNYELGMKAQGITG